MVIADPNKFEADILVNETDYLKVKLRGTATVQVDAVPGLSLPASITHISPSATIQSGVVHYQVKVEIQSIEALVQEQQSIRQRERRETAENITQGEIPERLKQAIEEGGFAQEQVEEMMERRQQRQAGQPEGQQRQMLTMAAEDLKLAEGMTVTVSIIVEERSNVLLVPNQAIISQGRETLVQVLKDGVIEERSVQTGISNWQYVEIISGLSEGEQVIVPQATATTPTTPGQRQPQPGIPRDIQRTLR